MPFEISLTPKTSSILVSVDTIVDKGTISLSSTIYWKCSVRLGKLKARKITKAFSNHHREVPVIVCIELVVASDREVVGVHQEEEVN